MMTKEQAISLADTHWWEELSAQDIVMVQLFEKRLCMPFALFHQAIEEALGRSVWTHEFACSNALQAEFLGDRSAPSLVEIMNLIPVEKRIVII